MEFGRIFGGIPRGIQCKISGEILEEISEMFPGEMPENGRFPGEIEVEENFEYSLYKLLRDFLEESSK